MDIQSLLDSLRDYDINVYNGNASGDFTLSSEKLYLTEDITEEYIISDCFRRDIKHFGFVKCAINPVNERLYLEYYCWG